MKPVTLLITLLLSAISWSQQTNETVDIDGANRTFVQYLPVGFDATIESLPVVFILHGIGDLSTNLVNAGFDQISDTARFIAIYPQGEKIIFGHTSWNNGTLLASSSNDFDFFDALIDDMILNHNADPTKIYIEGFSMGSIMAYKLACELNNRVAAIGALSGTMSTEDITHCAPSYITPVIHFHGTLDPIISFASGALPSLSLVPETLNFWINAHGCSTTADSTQIIDSTIDDLKVDRFVYQTCSQPNALEFWRVNGGSHNFFAQPDNDFSESIECWNFLRQW
ncbi:MAG: hypothetical protein HRT57_15915 [Crocinitomicaceae bacterium]|nr:hypothetical protein [Crocinitomicaceae bacterium]